ncbi:MAG TPA: hypothetical protein VFY25_10170 [Anaerolineales bacterium]|nr:hypothetical protein [Anaerolineales bacterium]
MKKILYPVCTAILIAVMLVSPAGAGGYKLSSAFTLGSLIDNGVATGLGRTDWVIELLAEGRAAVVCVNHGSNPVPGQSSPRIEGKGTQDIPSSQVTKNGKAFFTVRAVPDEELNPVIAWDAGGCPNSNWTALVDFVYWDHAVVSLKDPLTLETVATFKYVCVTTRTGPRGDPNSTFDDGLVSCKEYFN